MLAALRALVASGQTALSFATTPESAGYRKSIEQGLYSLYATRTNEEHARVSDEDEANRKMIDDMLSECYRRDAAKGGAEEASARHGLRTQKLSEMYDRVSRARARPAVPESLCCQITFDIMRDPVLTPAGHTYEREALEQHIQHNGPWDPVTRQALQVRSGVMAGL